MKAAAYCRVSSSQQKGKNQYRLILCNFNEADIKNPKDNGLELASAAIDWTDDAIRKFASLDSLLFRGPRESRGPLV